MRRGDIVTVAGGVYATKPRPALVIQDDRFDATDSLPVCPFTSTEVDAPLLRVAVTADQGNGLQRDSFLMVDKITTIRRSNALEVVGRPRRRRWWKSRGDFWSSSASVPSFATLEEWSGVRPRSGMVGRSPAERQDRTSRPRHRKALSVFGLAWRTSS